MKLTVAIATHNRARSLARALQSLCALRLGEVEAECLVVDNNSTDDTGAVARQYAARLPLALKYFFEPRLGLSPARNHGVHEARGDFVFFIDDDVVVEPDWALELLGEMERQKFDAAGGVVLPLWSAPPPPWLGPRIYPKLSVHDPEDVASGRILATGCFGANIGFRRTIFERFGGFREELGVRGSGLIGGEETELIGRIMQGGGSVGFVPRAVVHHVIGSERLSRAYLRRKSFEYGIGSALAGGRSHNRLDKLLKNAFRMAGAAARGDAHAAFYHQLECVNFFGYWRGRLLGR